MKTRFILIAILLLGISVRPMAQTITNYSFSSTNGTFTALTGGATTTWTGNTDDAVSALIPIGFDFWYMGTRYTSVGATTNGWISLGTTATTYQYTNDLSSAGSPRPVIAPLWDDLDISANSNVTYSTTGTAGNRVLTLQYLNVKWNYQALGSVCSFQVKLYEGTGKVEFIYRSDAGAAYSPSASIGITASGTGTGNFLSVHNNGNSVSSSTEYNITSKRTTGKTYAFTAPVPTAPTNLGITNVGKTGMTLNWTDASSNETGFAIYRSTDGVNYTFAAQTAANATTAIQSGLSENTTYYWRVYAITEGALSTAVSGSQATSCNPPAAPAVTSPVYYCQGATATPLTATGANLWWLNAGISGTAGGATALTTTTYVDGAFAGNNKKTNFSTTTGNVTITTVDYYIPAWQSVSALVLGLFNSSGILVATSSTTTSLTAGTSPVAITNTFNYTLAAAGNYSIGIVSGSGVIGSDNPSFPITEPTGTVNITGVSSAGSRCFNNIRFATGAATAPVPSTATAGSTDYLVTQTVNGCTSAAATITVIVTSPNISQIPAGNLIANYPFNGNANDATGNNNGILQNAPALTADRFGNNGKAYSFDGTSQYISTANAYTNPTNFTISTWFKTNTTTGGKLIGFGREQTGSSGQYDRHIYMNNAGQLYFGIYNGTVHTVSSVASYNDNNWHLATATLSATAGMVLYVDGVQVAANAAATNAENFTGYWRIGYDNMSGWTSQPSSHYFKGNLDDALIYHRDLNAAEVAILYNSPDGAGNNGPACAGSLLTLNATTMSGATYAWTGPGGFSSTQQNPSFTYTPAKAGTYTLQVTVNGCTATAWTNVSSGTNAGQWTGNISTDWADGNNWCTGVAPTAADNVVISAGATRMPVINGIATCSNLTVSTGATLTLASGGTLQIAGTLTNSGTFTADGTVNFNGTTGQQTFSGVSAFYNLTVSNPVGLLLPAAITVNNNLLIAAGTLNANNFNIWVKGNWTNNAAAAAFTAGTATVTFNGKQAQAIGGTYTTTFNHLVLADTSNTVTLTNNVLIGGNLSVSTGTVDLGIYTANRTTAGGELFVANNAVLKIGGTNTFPVNYSTNTLVVASTVEYAGANQVVANQSYGNLVLSSAAGEAVKTMPSTALTIVGNLSSTPGAGISVSFTAASNITVNGNVSIGASTTFNGGGYVHAVAGNWTNNGAFNGNTSTVLLTGASKNVGGSGAQNFNHLTITGSQITFTNGSITLSGNLATSGAGSFTQASGGTLSMTGTGTSISGAGIALDNLTITGTVTTSATVNITGHLTVSGSLTATAGIITLSGASKTISGAGNKTFYVLNIPGAISTAVDFTIASGLSVNGSFQATAGTATFTGTSSLSGVANLFHVAVNGTSLALSSNATMGVAGALTIQAGNLDVSTYMPNVVTFNGTGAQQVNALTYCRLTTGGSGAKTATGSFTTLQHVTIGSGSTLDPGPYTHIIFGDWYNNGSFVPGSSTIEFKGPATGYIRGATTFHILTMNLANASTQVFLQSHITAATVNMTQGMILTGQDTLTITNTRTGNGKILGHIQRNHTFATGVAYAFKNPYNTITFASVASVNSITVTVKEEQINDFPAGGAVNLQYNIAIPAGTYNATLRLAYEDDELNGHDESSLTLWRYSASAWSLVGKSANDATLNYVEQSDLTDITGRWTLSDLVNHVRWNGSVSSDWHTAANWTAVDGSPSIPPAATDIVDIGTAGFTHQPVISGNAAAKNVHFGSAQAVTLTLATGGALTVAGNIDGGWTSSITHSIQVNDQTLTVNGNMKLSDGIQGHSINLAIGTGNVQIGESLVQSGNAAITFTGAGILFIADDFEHNGGDFTPGTGTVVYNGATNQHIAHVNYHHLTIDKPAGIATIDSMVNIGGHLLVAGSQLDNNSTLHITGDVTIDAGAIMQNAGLLYVGGNWTRNGTYTSTGDSIYFNGSGTQTISPTTFNNLIVNKPVGSTAVLTGNLVINGDFTVTSGTLNVDTFSCNRSAIGGIATLDTAGTIILGANNPPLNFSSYVLASTSTVVYNGTDQQIIAADGIAFGNLTLSNTGSKLLASSLVVNGDLSIGSGTVFNADSNTITLRGNWTDQGTFMPATSTVLFAGASKNITGNSAFYNAIVTGSYTIFNNITFNELLHITSTGSLQGGSSVNVTMNGDLINSGVLYSLGTTTYTGNRVQTLRLVDAITTVALTVNFNGTVSPVLNSTTAPQFGYLNINNTGGVNPSVGWTVLYSMTVGAGASFNGGTSTHRLLGNVTNNGTVTSNGILNFSPSAAATVNLGNSFYSTGTVIFGGAGAMTLTGEPDSLTDVIIANTNAAGITPPSGWTIANNFSINTGCTLQAGSYVYKVGGNFTNNGTLNSGTSTFILNGATHQDVYTQSAFNNLTIDKSADYATLFSNATVNGVLNFTAGNIETSAYVLTLSASGTVTGAAQQTGWVFGKLQKNVAVGATVKAFEVGDSANYTPMQVAFANVTTAGNLTAFTTTHDHPQINSSAINASKSVNRYWTLNNNGIAFTSYNATFHFVETDVDPGTTNGAIIAGRYNDGAWTYPSIGAVTSTSLEAVGLTAFIDFQIGEMILIVKTWDGGAGTRNWGDAANWNTDGVPTVNDEVELTRADTININVPAVAKKLLLNNNSLQLTIEAGNSLAIAEDLTLVNGTFNTAAAFPSVGGVVNVSGGTVGFTGNGAQSIPAYQYNNLTSSSTGSRILANSGVIGITGAFTPGSNAYTISGSTIEYNHGSAQNIATFNYYNLTLGNSGEKMFSAGTTGVAGALTIMGNATANTTTAAATISYNGNNDQTVTPFTYHNLDVASSGGVVTLQDISIGNDLSVSSGVLAIGHDASARIITVQGNIAVAAGATLQVPVTSDAVHQLTVAGDVTNNGILDLRSDANSVCNVTFNKVGVQTLAGTGVTTRFNSIILNQGTANNNHLDVTATNFSAPEGFLTLQNGSFNLNSTGTVITPFISDIAATPYLIPASAGLWVNAGTVQSANMNWTVAGHIKVTGGMLNMGSITDNVVTPQSTAVIEVNGGALNLASRISNPGIPWTLLMKGGTFTVNTQGSTAAGVAPFNMDAAGSLVNTTGGTLVIQQAGGSTGQYLGYKNLAMGGPGFRGGTLQIGNAATPANQQMDITSLRSVYNLTVNSANATALLLNTNITVSNNVAIAAGALDINNLALRIGGSISNSGIFTASEGTIEMNGLEAQTIPAGAFTGNRTNNLTISNEAGVTLAGTLEVTGILLAAIGEFNTGGYLTLISTATQTALIDGSGAGEVTGNVTMQRYVPSGFGYKYFSSPFQDATVNEFSDDLNLSASFPTLYRFDESLTSSGWVNYTNTAGLLNPGEGYAANLGPSFAPKTVDITGVVNNGAVNFPLLYNHNKPYTQGFNLVGNPYPSPIDWDAGNGWTRTNIDNAVYYFNAGATNQYTGTYSSYINGVSSDGTAGNIIAAMQGFFVHVSDGAYPVAASLSINNNARVNNLVPDFRRRSPLTLPLLRLSAGFADEQKPADHLVVYFDDADASKGFDREMDALKLMNTDSLVPSLYVIAPDTAKLSICAWPGMDSTDIIPLGLQTKRSGWITFNMTSIERIPKGKHVYLYDAKTGQRLDVNENPKYRVLLEGGHYTNRFFLVFGQPKRVSQPVVANGTFTVFATGNTLYAKLENVPGEKCQVMVTNMLGQVVMRKLLTGNGRHELGPSLRGGVYVVSFYVPQQPVISKKISIAH